jgi:hypothetical protein
LAPHQESTMKLNLLGATPALSERAARRWSSLNVLAVGLGLVGASLAGQATAGCSSFGPEQQPLPLQDGWSAPRAAGFVSTVFRPGSAPALRAVVDRNPRAADIVGTWRFSLVSDGSAYPFPIPYGAVVDFGTAQWHPDGTEIMISGARPPGSGDVCMGSWEQTGPSTYKLRHIALAWANGDSSPPASPAVYVGPAIIREEITLNSAGTAFAGRFTIDQYAKDEVTLIEHIAGTLSATRFTAD